MIFRIFKIALSSAAVILAVTGSALFAQSSDQNFPTPITTNEIRGAIRARDIGDSRSTSYFYAFDGVQGDIFVNVQTRNFDGDIDVFTADVLKPLAKIVIYADAGVTETGRVVYLRKGERMLLRIEGRPPDDNPASFSIKFAGSFVALKPSRRPEDPATPRNAEGDGVRLNSAGAAIPRDETKSSTNRIDTIPKKVPFDPDRNKVSPKNAVAPSTVTKTKDAGKPVDLTVMEKSSDTKPTESKPAGDPLATIHLMIVLKDGKRIDNVMSNVLRFSADNGTYTLVLKSGNIIRLQIMNVLKVSIE